MNREDIIKKGKVLLASLTEKQGNKLDMSKYTSPKYDVHYNQIASTESALHEQLVMLPCPFCGGKAEIKRMGTNKVSMIIGCTECSCTLETGETWIDEHSQWNKLS